MDTFTAVIGTLGVGGGLGYCAGLALKTIGKLVGCAIGIVFILMQVLAYYGVAQWHWDAVAKHSPHIQHAASSAWSSLWKVLTYNLPFSGGFGAGFYLAVRR